MKKKLAFLLAIGIPKEIAKAICTAEDLPDDFDAEENTTTVRGALGESFKQDDDFLKPIKNGLMASMLNVKEKEIIKASKGKITAEEVDAMPPENRINKLIAMLAERMSAAPVKKEGEVDDKDKEIEKLNKEIELRDGTITKYKDEIVPAAERKAVEVEHSFHIRGDMQKAATAGERKLVLALDKTTQLLLDDVSQEYDLAYDPATKRTVLKEKGKDVIAHNPKERSKALTLEDVVPVIGEKNGYFVVNNGGGDDKNKGGGSDKPEAPKYVLPGLAKAQAHEKANPVPAGS